MTAKEFAELLNGRQYRDEIGSKEEKIAKESSLLVIFANSDDTVEFRGAIDDEIYGRPIYVIKGNIVTEYDFDEDSEVLKKYGITITPDLTVNAIWQPESLDSSWLITVDEGVKHYNFDIFDDDDLFCRGVVVDMGLLKHGN